MRFWPCLEVSKEIFFFVDIDVVLAVHFSLLRLFVKNSTFIEFFFASNELVVA